MSRTTLFLILFISTSVLADAQYNSSGFNLLLLGDWKPNAAYDQQISYYSESLGVNLVGFYKIVPVALSDTKREAYKLKESHINAEIGYPPSTDYPVTIEYSVVTESSKGHLVSYYGSDSTGRYFRYLGIVTATKIISIHIESRSQSKESLEVIFDQLIDELKY
jgi:hypothetical protein